MAPDASLISRRTFLAGGLSAAAAAPLVSGQSAEPTKTSSTEDLHFLGLTELASRIRRRALSPVDITKAQLARIESLDSQLSSYAAVLADLALAQARKAEAEIRSGRYSAPLT